MSVNRDVTWQDDDETRMVKAKRYDAMVTLSASIAHELNSMLLAMGIYLNRLNRTPAGPSGPDPSIAKAITLIQQAQSLSASLLELFTGAERVEAPILAVDTWLAACVGRLADALPPDVFITLALLSELKPVYADPVAMEQVMRILVGNASDALDGRGEIRVTAKFVEENGQTYVEIRVIDEGPGIPEANRARLFEPFFTTRSRSRRSGLGLALAKRLVDHMGGLIFHESNTPTGSIFIVRLRVATPETKS